MTVMSMYEALGNIEFWSLSDVTKCCSKGIGRAIQPRNICNARVESVGLAEDRDKKLSLCCVRYGEHKQHLTGV